MSGEQLLVGNGSVTHKQAADKATFEYRKYKTRNLSDVEQDYLDSIKYLEQRTDKNSSLKRSSVCPKQNNCSMPHKSFFRHFLYISLFMEI